MYDSNQIDDLKTRLTKEIVEYIDGLLEDHDVNECLKKIIDDVFEDILKFK